jgi:hypothetical protein
VGRCWPTDSGPSGLRRLGAQRHTMRGRRSLPCGRHLMVLLARGPLNRYLRRKSFLVVPLPPRSRSMAFPHSHWRASLASARRRPRTPRCPGPSLAPRPQLPPPRGARASLSRQSPGCRGTPMARQTAHSTPTVPCALGQPSGPGHQGHPLFTRSHRLSRHSLRAG